MADQDDPYGEDDHHERRFTAPYGKSHPIPTIQGYKQIQKDREEQEGVDEKDQSNGIRGTFQKLFVGDKPGQGDENAQGWAAAGQNLNTVSGTKQGDNQDQNEGGHDSKTADTSNDHDKSSQEANDQDTPTDTTETVSNETDPKAKRKAMKGRNPEKDAKTRHVTDPVTHLPIDIHDFTEKELNEAPTNLPEFGDKNRLSRSRTGEDKDGDQLGAEKEELDSGYEGMQKLFPPPSFQELKTQNARVYQKALLFSMAGSGIPFLFASGVAFWMTRHWQEHNLIVKSIGCSTVLASGLFGCLASYIGTKWLSSRLDSVWDDETWAAARREEKKQRKSVQTPESSMWLNFIIAAIWPLINPELFNSLVDTLEDVMQASLPKIVRMIAIEDFGQGKSAIRILGVRSLPAGAAAKSVSKDGKLKDSKKGSSDRDSDGQGQVDSDKQDKPGQKDENQQDEQSDANLAEGLEAESGDFLNLEIAFSYRATPNRKGIKQKSDNAHLYLVFYLPSNIPVPVWVAVDGIVGIVRMRIQTAPDPPFINLCTLSFMGQPKASISCVPLIKKGPNLMDLPFLSSFVQSSIDAAFAEYVAPKSITLDLKQMLQGDDFKKDSTNRGVLYIKIHSASGMETGDTSIPLLKDGSSDCYISCGWAKFSKPLWSSKIIVADMNPVFEEHCFILVGPGELNADERLRIQLWDSDKTSADDDLGRVEVDLDELMKNENSKGKMWQREDNFIDLDGKSSKPGSIKWEVGYYEKVSIRQDQFDSQQLLPDIKNLDQLKKAVDESTKKKLREAPRKLREEEQSQQRKQEFYEQENSLICAAPPPKDFPSGILSVQIHNAQGLEIASLSKEGKEEADESLADNELPSPYCCIIMNGKMVYKTRTKPKNSNPFFNAGTERFIRNWEESEVFVAVRDSRVHENDPLLGIIHLPLEKVFGKKAQSNETYPLCGGVGYGKLRVSMIFRAIDIKLPQELQGWDYGTVEIGPKITTSNLDEGLRGLRLKLSGSINRGKMKANGDGTWHQKHNAEIHLAITKRYASSVLIEFRSDRTLKDKTAGWAILWLKDIPDDEQKELELTVWKGDQKMFKRAKANVLKEMGDKAGSIKVNVKFYAGLHDGHRGLKDSNIQNVLECLAVAEDNHDLEIRDGDEGSDSSSSDSSSDEDKDETSKGPIDKIKDYKDRSGTLHRQNKGLMQWKIARKGDWLQSKVTEDLPNKLKDVFSRKGKVQGVETEV